MEYFTRINVESLEREMLARVVYDTMLKGNGSFSTNELRDIKATVAIKKSWTPEIAKGSDSAQCKFELLAIDGRWVRVRRSSGKLARMLFETQDGRAQLVNYIAAD